MSREREREKRGVEVTVDPEHLKPEAGAQEADPLRVLGGAAASFMLAAASFMLAAASFMLAAASSSNLLWTVDCGCPNSNSRYCR